jgi:hypothetical protein
MDKIIREVGIGVGLLNAMNAANAIKIASATRKYHRGIAGPFGSLITGADNLGFITDFTTGAGAGEAEVVARSAE